MTSQGSRSLEIGIVGGSIAGLATALALADSGHKVQVFERDKASLPESPVDAFQNWHRPGVPQLRHSHAFLARLRNLLRNRFPNFLDRLLDAGAKEVLINDLLGPEIANKSEQESDKDLVLIASRRVTFEWALHLEAKCHPGISIQQSQKIMGVLRDRSKAHIIGLRTTSGRAIKTDLVVDASGRNTKISKWLRDANLPQPELERHNCGIFYCTRFFQTQDKSHKQTRDFTIAADLGFMKYAVFQGDRGIFSVTLAASPDDDQLTPILKTNGFERACRSIPRIARFTENAVPLGEVRAISGLESMKRTFSRDVPLGLVLIGDSLVHTNPLYGRGATMAFMQAVLLSESLIRHGTSHRLPLASILDEDYQAELFPWYEFSLSQDENSTQVALDHRSGRQPSETRPDGKLDPREYMRSLVREGLIPAMAQDGLVARKAFRGFHMMDPPGSLLKDPEIIKRVTAYFRQKTSPSSSPSFTRNDLISALDTQ